MSDHWASKAKAQSNLHSDFGNCLPSIPKHIQGAYREFYASLTTEQLESLGGKPHPSNLSNEVRPLLKEAQHIPHADPTDDPKGNSVFSMLATDAPPASIDDLPTTSSTIPAIIVLEIVRKVLHAWTSAPDRSTRLHGEVLGVALGIPGESISTLARKYGCTRQAISKRHRSIIKALSLPPSVRMVLGRTKAAQVLLRKNIAIPTKPKRRKATPPTPNRG